MEKWKWELVTDSTKQLTNDITFIKTIILDHTSATDVIIYDEATGGTTKKFITIRNTTQMLTMPIILDDPAQLDNGCYLVLDGGSVWIQYRNG